MKHILSLLLLLLLLPVATLLRADEPWRERRSTLFSPPTPLLLQPGATLTLALPDAPAGPDSLRVMEAESGKERVVEIGEAGITRIAL